MEADFKKTNSYRSRGLVAFLLLLFLLTACNEYSGKNTYKLSLNTIELKSKEEIIAFKSGYLFNNPLTLLLLLPGPVFLLVITLISRRKKILIPAILLFLLSFSILVPQADFEKQLDYGIKAYREQDYPAALKYFQAAQEYLTSNAPLEFNIALCYYKLEKPGYAVFALKQAIFLDLTDTLAQIMLQLLEEEYELNYQIKVIPFLHPDIPYIGAIIFFNLAFILFYLLLKIKKGQLVIIFIFTLLFTLVGTAVLIVDLVDFYQKSGVVIDEQVSVRQIPEDTGKERIKLNEGTIVKILWEMQDYAFIETSKGLKGWIRNNSLLADKRRP